MLARFGDRLFYFIDEQAHRVGVPDDLRAFVSATRWLTRGPHGGFALVGAQHLVVIQAGRFAHVRMPARDASEAVGDVSAVLSNARTFGVVTAETDASDGEPEL